MSCEDGKITLKANTILYNGITYPTGEVPPTFKYNKKGNYDKLILYTGDDPNTALGYAAGCLSDKMGWIRKYKLLTDVTLVNVSEDQLHYEVDEVIKNFCDCNGYYLDWGGKYGKEIVFCNPENKLQLIDLFKCVGKGQYKSYNNFDFKKKYFKYKKKYLDLKYINSKYS